MNAATTDRIASALARVPAPLVTERARERLLAFGSRACPLADLIFFEHRLASDAADQVDVSISAASFAARAALSSEVRCLAAQDPATWAAASDSLACWAERGNAAAGAFAAAFLEYDLPLDAAGSSVPALFCRAAELSHPWQREHTWQGLAQVVRGFGGSGSEEQLARLAELYAALPENFHVAHLGFMFPRAGEQLRVELALPGAELGATLQRLGWSGSLTHVHGWLARAERGGWVTLALGLGPRGVCERLGIELFTAAGGEPELLAALASAGLCTPAKAQALLALLAADGGQRLELSHTKLVLGPGCALEAKAYLALHPPGARRGRLAAVTQIRARAARARSADPRSPAGAG